MTDRMLMHIESIALGAAWNMANLWCLSRILGAWLGAHSRRRAVAWLAAKLAVLYPAALVLLSVSPQMAPGFGIGFTLVLIAAIARFALRGRAALGAHGR